MREISYELEVKCKAVKNLYIEYWKCNDQGSLS